MSLKKINDLPLHCYWLACSRSCGHKAGICTSLQNLEMSTGLIDDPYNQTKDNSMQSKSTMLFALESPTLVWYKSCLGDSHNGFPIC